MWMMMGIDASAKPATKNAGVTKPAAARQELPVASCQLPENENAETTTSVLLLLATNNWQLATLHLMLADLVARKLLNVTSSGSLLFMRVKSTCMPRQIRLSSSVKLFNCSR